MSTSTTAAATIPPPAPAIALPSPSAPTLTPTELAALVEASAASGSLVGISAMTARLVGEMVGHARQAAQQLGAIAAPFGGPGKMLTTHSAIDPDSIDKITTGFTKTVTTAVQPQFDGLKGELKGTQDEVAAAKAQAETLKAQTDTLKAQAETLQHANDALRARFEDAERQLMILREQGEAMQRGMQEWRADVLQIVEDECREPCRRMVLQHAELIERLLAAERLLATLTDAESRPPHPDGPGTRTRKPAP